MFQFRAELETERHEPVGPGADYRGRRGIAVPVDGSLERGAGDDRALRFVTGTSFNKQRRGRSEQLPGSGFEISCFKQGFECVLINYRQKGFTER